MVNILIVVFFEKKNYLYLGFKFLTTKTEIVRVPMQNVAYVVLVQRILVAKSLFCLFP